MAISKLSDDTFLHWEALGWFRERVERFRAGWRIPPAIFFSPSHSPFFSSIFCISCQLRVFYFSFLMVRYIYPHFGCPSNIWWGFKLCQDTRLFCWLDKLPTTSRIKKLTLLCQVIGIGKGGNGVESSSLYTRFIRILLLVAVILLLVVSNKNFFVFSLIFPNV